MQNDKEKLLQSLKNAQRILLCGHENPDGDCLGSLVAMQRMLAHMGKRADVLLAGPIPHTFEGLGPFLSIVRPPEGANEAPGPIDGGRTLCAPTSTGIAAAPAPVTAEPATAARVQATAEYTAAACAPATAEPVAAESAPPSDSACPPANLADYDTLLALDCASAERTPLGEAFTLHANTLCMDHHVSNTRFAGVNWVDPGAAACGLMVLDAADALGLALDETMANALFVALCTDTGRFSFQNTTPACFAAAARLMAAEADITGWQFHIFSQRSAASTRMMGRMLATLQRSEDGRVAVAYTTAADNAEIHPQEGDFEGLVDVLRNIEGVEACAFVRARSRGGSKGSLRAHHADVQAVAKQLGGGGHVRAAGCDAAETSEQTAAILMPLLQKAVDALPSAKVSMDPKVCGQGADGQELRGPAPSAQMPSGPVASVQETNAKASRAQTPATPNPDSEARP